jgi:hypothetical protein
VLERAGYLDLNLSLFTGSPALAAYGAFAPIQHVPRIWSEPATINRPRTWRAVPNLAKKPAHGGMDEQDEFISLILPGNENQVCRSLPHPGVLPFGGRAIWHSVKSISKLFSSFTRQAMKDWKRIAYHLRCSPGDGLLQPLYRKWTRKQYSKTEKDQS